MEIVVSTWELYDGFFYDPCHIILAGYSADMRQVLIIFEVICILENVYFSYIQTNILYKYLKEKVIFMPIYS